MVDRSENNTGFIFFGGLNPSVDLLGYIGLCVYTYQLATAFFHAVAGAVVGTLIVTAIVVAAITAPVAIVMWVCFKKRSSSQLSKSKDRNGIMESQSKYESSINKTEIKPPIHPPAATSSPYYNKDWNEVTESQSAGPPPAKSPPIHEPAGTHIQTHSIAPARRPPPKPVPVVRPSPTAAKPLPPQPPRPTKKPRAV